MDNPTSDAVHHETPEMIYGRVKGHIDDIDKAIEANDKAIRELRQENKKLRESKASWKRLLPRKRVTRKPKKATE